MSELLKDMTEKELYQVCHRQAHTPGWAPAKRRKVMKKKIETRGRKPLPPGEKRVGVHVKLPPKLIAWLRARPEGVTATIETAVRKFFKLKG